MTEYLVKELGHLGDGLADGPVFVPGALPGETVTGALQGDRLTDVRIMTPSSARVSPPCRHARSCGGCLVQHAADPFVASWKREITEKALLAQGVEAEVLTPITSAPQSRRRAGFAARRTKKGAMAGFHARGSDVVIPVPDCQLVSPALVAALPMVETLARIGASRKGVLSVMVTETATGLDVVATGGKPLDTDLRSDLAQVTRDWDLARVTWDGEAAAQARVPMVDLDGMQVPLPPGAFLQATPDGEAALRDFVLRTLAGARHVVDLFSGCGTFALPLARDAKVHAVEGEAEMLASLNHGWRHAEGLRHVTCETRDLFRNPLLPEELARFDAAVIDPPRAGAVAQVAQLVRAQIPRIAYVSCSPTSFARDAAQLISAGYRMGPVQVVDQFRWSAHVELCAAFHRDSD